jgi:hypothetical protein
MNVKGSFAVCSFVGLLLAANVASLVPTGFDWSVGPVMAGMPATVRVTAAPCQSVKVTIKIGTTELVGQINEVPGSVVIDIPEGLQGLGYVAEVRCPTGIDLTVGIVM